MKMKSYEFRGTVIKEGSMKGKFVYGDLLSQLADGEQYPRIHFVTNEHKDEFGHTVATCEYWEVDPETVVQMIHVDRMGNKVYEGDPIRNESGWIKTASFDDYGTIKAGRAVLKV